MVHRGKGWDDAATLMMVEEQQLVVVSAKMARCIGDGLKMMIHVDVVVHKTNF